MKDKPKREDIQAMLRLHKELNEIAKKKEIIKK
jgi:hypothetical protein